MGCNIWNNWTYGDTSSGGGIPMKTGQTISYGTGDDGDLQDGRGAGVLTLSENNPFGNTDRFTDLTGAQTYADDIAIDWSQRQGDKVLGWYLITVTNDNFFDSLDAVNALSIGSYDSGWKMPNVNEYFTLLNFANYDFFDYVPINYIGFSQVWISCRLKFF